MAMSLQVNPKIGTTGFMPRRNTQKACKLNYSIRVSCKANFYEILSLGSKNGSVGFHEIKKAYRSMALQYHPDVCPSSTKEESTRRFVELREAYETLSNQVSRKLQDHELGFADNSLGFGGQSSEKRRSRFPKQVWENQLYRLKKRRRIQFERLESLLEYSLAYLNRAKQLLNYAKEPCKLRNFQGGALGAGAWASKSLAIVSIGDASSRSLLPESSLRYNMKLHSM